jgi:hypothetical protein
MSLRYFIIVFKYKNKKMFLTSSIFHSITDRLFCSNRFTSFALSMDVFLVSISWTLGFSGSRLLVLYYLEF